MQCVRDSTRPPTVAGKPSGPTTAGKSQPKGNRRAAQWLRRKRARNDHLECRRMRPFDAVNGAIASGHLTKNFLLLVSLS